jgi:hypothetical protein
VTIAIVTIVAATVQAQLKNPEPAFERCRCAAIETAPLDDSRRILDPTFGARDAHHDA